MFDCFGRALFWAGVASKESEGVEMVGDTNYRPFYDKEDAQQEEVPCTQ